MNLRFKPKAGPMVATIIVFPILVSLGFWQLDRAQQKRVIAATFAERISAAPTVLTADVLGAVDSILWAPLVGKGQYRTDLILLDNRIRDRQPGYEVFSIVRLSNDKQATSPKVDLSSESQLKRNEINLLVNRGWVPALSQREKVPTIDTPTTAQSISGHLRPLPATGIKLNKQSLNVEQLSDHIIRVQHIDVEQLEKRYDTFLAEAILYLDPNSPSGFDRSWSIPGVKPEKHEAYATQWFAMAAIVLGLFLFLNLKRQHDV